MFLQYEVKEKRVSKRYPAFGEKLYWLVVENLPYGFSQDKQGVVSFFRRHPDFGFDPTCTYAWLRGDVSGSKPLVVDNFKRILRFYIEKNGLRTIEEIHQWIASGPPKYQNVLESEEIQQLLQRKYVAQPDPEQEKELADREKLWKQLIHLVQTAALSGGGILRGGLSEPNLFVIQGPPGVGKTMWLERLQADPTIQARFDEILYASCDLGTSRQTFLDFWLGKIIPDQAFYPDHLIVRKAEMQKALQGKRVLLLADNLSSPEEIEALKPFRDLGCLLVVTTRFLEVSRQADYSHVVELTAYSRSDVIEYYSKNYASQPSSVTQEKLLKLAEMVCYNPLGLNISLRRVAEEGLEAVMAKVRLAPSISKGNVFADLHKPLWLAYNSLRTEDQERFRRLGTLPNLASYDEDRLGMLWGVSKTIANETLIRFEKEAGLVRHCRYQNGFWHFHPQVLNYARYCLSNQSPRVQWLSRLLPVRLAVNEKRPREFHHIYARGVQRKVAKKYWQMIREDGRRRRLPLFLAELRRLVDLTYSTDWAIFKQLTSNCALADYSWGYRNYLGGMQDVVLFAIFLFLVGAFDGMRDLFFESGYLRRHQAIMGILNFFLLMSTLIWLLYLMYRKLRRRYDWGQLLQKVSSNVNEFENEEYGGETFMTRSEEMERIGSAGSEEVFLLRSMRPR